MAHAQCIAAHFFAGKCKMRLTYAKCAGIGGASTRGAAPPSKEHAVTAAIIIANAIIWSYVAAMAALAVAVLRGRR